MSNEPESPYPPPPASSNGWNSYPAQPGGGEVPAWQQPPAPSAYGYGSGPGDGYGYGYGQPPGPQQSGLYFAAAIVNWVTLGIFVAATCGIGIIAAAWFVPMTIQIHKGAKDRSKHTALGICTLLFCNIISGILILVEDGNRPSAPSYT